MKASELRIGNLVWDDYSGEMIVSSIGEETVNLKKRGGLPEGRYILKTLQSIPLTEEWLVKLGFTKYEWCSDCAFIKFNNGHIMLRYYNDKWHCTKTKVTKDSSGHKTSGHRGIIKDGLIQYVHQLQNLYFALTGNELTLKSES